MSNPFCPGFSRMRRRRLSIESLENRTLLHGGVEVTPTHVITEHDTIPRFATNPDFIAITNGNWSNPNTWNTRRVPVAESKVQIPHGVNVTFDSNSPVPIESIEVSGSLNFATNIDTQLLVCEIMVMPDGAMSVGTAANPVTANTKIVFMDEPTNPIADPESWGMGLLVFGEFNVHGIAKTSSYVRLAKEPVRGASQLELTEVPVGWKSGDVLVLPDTSSAWSPNRVEELVIQSVSGRVVTLTKPLAFSHPGAKLADGTLQYLPHVGNISRNVVFTSENPLGFRGHTAFFANADVDVRYAQFSALGRTTNEVTDDTVFAPSGQVVKIGSNQAGRYSFHLHHVAGAVNPTNAGYQFQVVGNAITDGLRWGLAIHNSSYGFISKNTFYDIQGSAIVAEDGTEVYNVIDGNFIVKMTETRTGAFKEARAGEGIWLRGPLHQVTNNVVANAGRTAYLVWLQHHVDIPRPFFRGAEDDLDMAMYNPIRTPMLAFSNNEAYATPAAYESWSGSAPERQYVTNLTVWHTSDNTFALSSYENEQMVIDGVKLVSDFASMNPRSLPIYQPITTIGIQAIRESKNLIVRNSEIRGAQTGIRSPDFAAERTLIADSIIQAYVGLEIGLMTNGGTSAGKPDLPYSSITIENTRFLRMPENLASPQQWAIIMNLDTSFASSVDLTAINEVYIYDYNGVPGANYRVYFPEQAPDYVMPNSVLTGNRSLDFIASPESGLTNKQAWDKYGVAIAGAVAPTREVDGDNGAKALARGTALGIRGLVFPIAANAASKPAVNAGPNRTAVQNQTMTLRGTGDGLLDWSRFSGPGEVKFSNFRDGTTSATFTEPGTYQLRLTSTLNSRRSFDDVTVVVSPSILPFNKAPRVNAGIDQVLSNSNKYRLLGTVEDDGLPSGTVNAFWRQVSGPEPAVFSNLQSPTADVVFPARGTYVLELVANDGNLETVDSVTIEVKAIVPLSPLLGNWKLDSVVEGTTKDSSLHALDAEVSNATRIAGQFGSALELNAGYIAMPTSELLMPTEGLTVAFWVKPNLPSTQLQPLFVWERGSWDAYELGLINEANRAILAPEITTPDGVSRPRFFTSSIPSNSWTHLALTFSNINGGEMTVYRDGILVGSQSNIGTSIAYALNGSKRVTFGMEQPGSARGSYNGGIDDIYIYDYALSNQELALLMRGITPTPRVPILPFRVARAEEFSQPVSLRSVENFENAKNVQANVVAEGSKTPATTEFPLVLNDDRPKLNTALAEDDQSLVAELVDDLFNIESDLNRLLF